MNSRLERLATLAAWAYLVLLPLNLRVHGPLVLHDLLAPVFLAAVLWRADWRRWWRRPDAALAGWVVLAAVVTLLRPGRLELYELAIAAYMALLYAFFSRTCLTAGAGLGRYAVAVVLSFWAVGLGQVLLGRIDTHGAYVGSALGFLSRRFGYTFANPNLFGSFAALPLAAALLAFFRAHGASPSGPAGGCGGTAGCGGRGAGRLWRLALAAAAFGVPLVLSASRHLVLSLGLICGAWPWLLGVSRRRLALAASWGVFLLLAALLTLTILVPFFPLTTAFPYINARSPGMYLIHQDAYRRMVLDSPGSLLLGIGPRAVRERYPAAVDPAMAERVLREYRMSDALLPSFLEYMDAHNEYLNQAAAFGLPALLCLAAFLIGLAVTAARRQGPLGPLLAFYVAGLAFACLWDDLLSKRWIWVTLGLLAAAATARPAAQDTATPRAAEAAP
ncbi:MAG: hypothetical protein GX595_14145 [Lentisphaerae bacterium]|nr:hypothetical protein [Lentisphaerota bacterium]